MPGEVPTRSQLKQIIQDDLEPLFRLFGEQADARGLRFVGDEERPAPEDQILSGPLPDDRSCFALQWVFEGAYGSDPGPDSRSTDPSGNRVRVEGVSIVELPGLLVTRYIDWLSAYAQLGIVQMRRPSVHPRNAPAFVEWTTELSQGYSPQLPPPPGDPPSQPPVSAAT